MKRQVRDAIYLQVVCVCVCVVCTDRHLNRQGYEKLGKGRQLPIGRMCVCVVCTDRHLNRQGYEKAGKGRQLPIGRMCVCVVCTDRHLNRQGYDKAGKGRQLPIGRMCVSVCVCVQTDTLTDKAMKSQVRDASYLQVVCVCVCVCVCTDRHLNRQGYEKAGKGRQLPIGRMCVCVWCVQTDTLTDKAMKRQVRDASYLQAVCVCVCGVYRQTP